MAKLPVFKLDGTQNGEIELPADLFETRVNDRLLQLALTAYAGNQRRGTHDTKERKEVSGGGKKPWKQKGTGRARQGSIRAPQWRGGGTIFGPTPRDYDTWMSQEMRLKALISALSQKYQEKQLTIIEDLSFDQPRTKYMIAAIKALGLSHVRSLCVVAHPTENLKRASQNLSYIFSIKRVSDVNAYHILRKKQLVLERSAVEMLEKRALGTNESSLQKETVAA